MWRCVDCGSTGTDLLKWCPGGYGYPPHGTKPTRPSWDDYFFEITKVVATRATCPRKRVGCVFVKDNRILGTGYNGAPPGEPHCDDVGCDMVDNHCKRTTHAEISGISTAAKYGISLNGATAYLTISPCQDCQKAMKAAGVDWKYIEEYP